MKDHNFKGSDRVRLALALTRADVRPFTSTDWSGWAGACGDAHMVRFHADDHKYFMRALGISHWGPDNCVVILDDTGLTWNGFSPVNMQAWQVNVTMDVAVCDPGTREEFWAVDTSLKGLQGWELHLAALPPEVQATVLACPSEARVWVLQGYLNAHPLAEEIPPVEVWVYRHHTFGWRAVCREQGELKELFRSTFENSTLTWVRDNVPGAKLMSGRPPVTEGVS